MKKEIIVTILFVLVFIGMFIICRNRFERIENNDLIIVEDSYMDR